MRENFVLETLVSAKDPSQGWRTLKDLAHNGRLMSELTR